MRKYIGITIGPIFDTVRDASTPASLWFASSIFSDITRRLCCSIVDKFSDVIIYSPGIDREEIKEISKDGIGKYHDRIIFSTDEYSQDTLDSIIRDVKRNTAEVFPERYKGSSEFFERYLQIHYVVMDEDEIKGNCVLDLSKYLNALELVKTFPDGNVNNPITKLFITDRDSVNRNIKESALFTAIEENGSQLIKNNKKIKQILDIASSGRLSEDMNLSDASDDVKKAAEKKYPRYFAVVNADGDKMGKFLESISSAEVTEFSKRCLRYAKEASKLVGEFGGTTIYVGGDDMLFLAPVRNSAGRTVFELCDEINTCFRNTILKDDKDKEDNRFKEEYIPTISFGVSVQYYKFPLYEAFDISRQLLEQAKDNGGNAQMINLQKHSGQSVRLLVRNGRCGNAESMMGLSRFLASADDADKIQSIMYTMRNFSGLINVLNSNFRESSDDNRSKYITGWMNLFDNSEQEKAAGYIRKICEAVYDEIITAEGIKAFGANRKDNAVDSNTNTIVAVLQLAKFFGEKSTEDELIV